MASDESRHRAQTMLDAFIEHKQILAGYLAQRLLLPEDIEDLLQETFILAQQAGKKRDIRSPKGYLFVIARNLLSKKFARQTRERTKIISDAEFSTLPSPEPPIDRQLHYREHMKLLENAVRTLPPQCRRVFILRKFCGRTHREIARDLDISTSTVERHITIALTRLDSAMRQQGYEFDDPGWSDQAGEIKGGLS